MALSNAIYLPGYQIYRTELEEPNPFTPAEIKSILRHSDDQTRNLFQFAFWTDMHTSELIAYEWDDIDFQLGVVRVSRARS